MARKRHTAEEIVSKLRQVDVLTGRCQPVSEATRSGANVVSYGGYVALQMAEVAIPTANVPRDFSAHRATTATVTTSASVRRSKVMHRRGTDGRVRPNARENGQIRTSNAIWDAWKTGSRSCLAGLPTSSENAYHSYEFGRHLGIPGLRFTRDRVVPLAHRGIR